MLKRVCDTMALLNFEEPLKTLRNQLDILCDYINNGGELALLQAMASYVISVESALTQYIQSNGSSVCKTEAELHFDQATETVVREVCSLLEQVKESIVEYVADQYNDQHLTNVPAILAAAAGALTLSSFDKVAAAVLALIFLNYYRHCEHRGR